MKNKILLNPGPTNTSDLTKLAQSEGSDVCHRTDEFYNVILETKALLLERFLIGVKNENRNNWNIGLIGGSGTVALEAMIGSLAPLEENLVVNAGKYGLRMKEMMELYKIEEQTIKANTIDDLTPKTSIANIFFVENETTTGEKFDPAIMTEKYPKSSFFIDATAAFGSSRYSKAIEQIGAISFCSNKCLQSTPGLGIVIWRKSLPLFYRNYYTYLSKYVSSIPPFTLPVQSVYALKSALKENKDNATLFDERSQRLIKDLNRLNIKCLNRYPSNSILGFSHPTRNYEDLKCYLLKQDIVIYSGVEGVPNSFRIATMSVDFDVFYNRIIEVFHESVY